MALCSRRTRSPRVESLIQPVKRSPSAESAAPVHGCLGSLCRAARLCPFCFAAGSTDRADAVAIQRVIAARPAVPRCDGIVGQPCVPACVAHVRHGFDVYLRGPRRLDIEPGRHHRDLTPAVPPTRTLISWHGTSERCTRTRTALVYAAARRWWCRHRDVAGNFLDQLGLDLVPEVIVGDGGRARPSSDRADRPARYRPGPSADRPARRFESIRRVPTVALLEDSRRCHSCTSRGCHSASVVSSESRNRCRDAAISASASDRPTHSAPSTLLPGTLTLVSGCPLWRCRCGCGWRRRRRVIGWPVTGLMSRW